MREFDIRSLLTQVLIISLITAQILAVLPSVIVNQALATPLIVTANCYSQPQAHSASVITVTNPVYARDKNNATFAYFSYGIGPAGYFQLATFKAQDVRSSPYPVIKQVDLKMKYGAQADIYGETYKIDYLVSPSTTLQSLVAPTGSAHANTTEVWAARTEPNDGVWTWIDVQNIKLRVTTSGQAGPSVNAKFFEFEGWAIVVVESSPKLFVNPANITEPLKDVGSTVSVDIKLENVSDVSGVEFKLRYDPNLLQADPNWIMGNLFPPTPPTPSVIENETDNMRGYVWISYARNPGESSVFGSGTLATISFLVIGKGLTTLRLYDTIIGDLNPDSIPHDVANGYFRNVAMPYGATVEVKVPPPEPKDSPFTVDINITKGAGQSGAFGLYSWEFNMTYDKTILTALNVLQGPFLLQNGPVIFDKTVNDAKGWVWANATLWQDPGGAWGNGTLARIQFDIKADGNSPLNFVASKTKLTRLDYGAAVPFPASVSLAPPFYQFPATTVNGDADVEYVPHDVAVTATMPAASLAFRGYDRDVDITVQNQGGWPESFYVSAYYESGKADVDGYEADAGWEGAVPWTLTGASPYVDAADYPTNYITASGTNNKIGNFTFEDIPSYGKTLVGVKLYIKTWNTVDDFMYVYLNLRGVGYDTWSQHYLVTPTSHVAGGDYVVVDIFNNLDTWEEVNNTKVRIRKAVTSPSADTVGIDHMYLVTESQIGTKQAVTDLPIGDSQTLTFTWDTSNVPYGDYEVFGKATTALRETDIIDNILSGGIIRLTIAGDANGDKAINIFDILAVKSRWGRTPASPDWIPEYDVNLDGAINIFDILTVKAHWGQSW